MTKHIPLVAAGPSSNEADARKTAKLLHGYDLFLTLSESSETNGKELLTSEQASLLRNNDTPPIFLLYGGKRYISSLFQRLFREQLYHRNEMYHVILVTEEETAFSNKLENFHKRAEEYHARLLEEWTKLRRIEISILEADILSREERLFALTISAGEIVPPTDDPLSIEFLKEITNRTVESLSGWQGFSATLDGQIRERLSFAILSSLPVALRYIRVYPNMVAHLGIFPEPQTYALLGGSMANLIGNLEIPQLGGFLGRITSKLRTPITPNPFVEASLQNMDKLRIDKTNVAIRESDTVHVRQGAKIALCIF